MYLNFNKTSYSQHCFLGSKLSNQKVIKNNSDFIYDLKIQQEIETLK